MFPGVQARARKPGDADSHGLLAAPALYPVANGIAFHPTFQVLRRSFSTHGKKEAHPTAMQAQLGHSDIRTTLGIYTQIAGESGGERCHKPHTGLGVILGLSEEVEPSSV